MKDKIVNKVAQSALVTFDLEELYPKGVLLEVDLSQWLDQGFILREKEFRTAIKRQRCTPISTQSLQKIWSRGCSTYFSMGQR